MEILVSYISNIIIFIGLYFTCFWVLILFNTEKKSNSKIKNWPKVSIIIPA